MTLFRLGPERPGIVPFVTASSAANAGFGLARLAFGLGALAAPSKLGATWVGAETASRPPARVILRALGVRDVALGAGTVAAALSGSARPWLAVGVAADLGDVAVTLLGRDHLPATGARNTVFLASSAAIAGCVLIAIDTARGETPGP
jgi:hypothetical protein